MRQKVNDFLETDVAEKIAIAGTIINIILFVGLFFVLMPSFALVNIVDFEETDFTSTIFSTLLFLSVSFWIYFSAKAKAKTSLIISAAFMFITSIIYFGYGLFQPCFYPPLELISIIFGGSFDNFEPFSSIENSVVWTIFCILLCVIDKVAHIYLGCVSLRYSKLINDDLNKENNDNSLKKTKYLLIKIPIFLGAIILVISSIEFFVGVKGNNDSYSEIDRSAFADGWTKSTNLYESINSENISEYSKLYEDFDNDDMFDFGNSIVNCWDNSDKQNKANPEISYKEKRLFTGMNATFEPFDINLLCVGDGREKLLSIIPMKCANEVTCKYLSDGTIRETFSYNYYDGKYSYGYNIVFVNNQLVYAFSSEQKDTFLTSIGLSGKTKIIKEEHIGEEKYREMIARG